MYEAPHYVRNVTTLFSHNENQYEVQVWYDQNCYSACYLKCPYDLEAFAEFARMLVQAHRASPDYQAAMDRDFHRARKELHGTA